MIRKYRSFLVLFLFVGCHSSENQRFGSNFNLRFYNLDSEETGVDFNNKLISGTDMNIIEYLYYYNGGGVGLGDINNDGYDDIFFAGNEVSDQLYLNQGEMVFKNITGSAGIGAEDMWSTGVSMADVNNDGFLDIYVSTVETIKT